MAKERFDTVYEEYYDRVYKYAYTILLNKEDAEDVTEDTFMSAYSNYDKYDENRASIGTWLTRIAHNRAINFVRSASYSKKTDMPEEWESVSEDDFTEKVISSEMVLWLYAKLKPEDREFLNFRYVMELKDKEIAELIGMSEKTVNKRYQRLLSRCREIIKNEK